MHKTIASAAALSVAALTLGVVGAAQADSIGVKDPRDTSHGSDLRSVELRHHDKNVVVVTRHVNLRPDGTAGGAVFLDTDRSDRGPEFVFVGGYFDGTDYALLETEGFAVRKWGERADGFHIMRLDYDREQVRMRMTRRSLGNPDEVRVAVRVSGARTDGSSDGLVDWLGEPQSFTEPVARG